MLYDCDIHGQHHIGKWIAEQDHIKNKCPICGGLVQAQIPLRYMKAQITQFDANVQKKALSFLNDSPTGNLLILGPLGTGKSHLAAAIAAEAVKLGRAPYYTEALSASNRIMAERTCKQFQDKQLLIIDEMGRQYDTKGEGLRLFDLVNGRYNQMRPTVFIGNQTKAQFKEAVGDAIADRIGEKVKVILLTGESRRKAA